MASEKLAFFLQDCANMAESLVHTLHRLKEEPDEVDLVHQAFRYVHSIKSEADFLGLDGIANVAHEMEERLEQGRNGSLDFTGEIVNQLLSMVERLEEELFRIEESESRETLSKGAAEAPTSEPALEEAEAGSVIEAAPSATAAGPSAPEFNEFERRLLREAWERGERFYRLGCEIEESAPIKYAKAYLIVNNLEIVANVVKSLPPLEPADDDRFRELQVFLTSPASAQEIYGAVDVDQVARVSVIELSFESFAAQGVSEHTFERRPRSESEDLRIPNARYEELLEYAREIALIAAGIVPSDGSDLKELAPRLQGLLKELRKLPLQRELRHLPRFARDLAVSLGKRVQVQVTGGELLVDRRLLSHITDPLLHLVRNAVDHGIELPGEREAVGKSPLGTISVSATRQQEELVVRVEDDGRGIDEEEIRARAASLGMEGKGDLLEILVQPGFSTREEASRISGRGVGLDLVYQQATVAMNGRLRLESVKGSGSAFFLFVPAATSFTGLLLARCGDATIALQLRNVESRLQGESALLSVDPAGLTFYEELPVYELRSGLIERRREKRGAARLIPVESSLVVLDFLGRRLALLVDELLFERELPDDFLSGAAEVGPALYRVSSAGSSFLYPLRGAFR